MTSIFKNIRSGIHPHVKSNYSVIIFHSNSFYRSFSKKCGKKCSDDDDKPPPIKCLSPSSGDTSNPNTPNMYDVSKQTVSDYSKLIVLGVSHHVFIIMVVEA